MDRRKFISAAIGAAVIPQLPVVKSLPGYSFYDIAPAGSLLYPYLALEAEWQAYMTSIIANAFNVPLYMLETK